MTLSTGPWWWAPVFASGSMTTVPAHSFSAPARAVVIAAARRMPSVCGVFGSSASPRTTRTPLSRQSVIAEVSPRRHHQQAARRGGDDLAGGVADVALREGDPATRLGDPAVRGQLAGAGVHRAQVVDLDLDRRVRGPGGQRGVD